MGRLSEIAGEMDRLGWSYTSNDVQLLGTIAEVLDSLAAGKTIPAADLEAFSEHLKMLAGPLHCRWCGVVVPAKRTHYGLGVAFCSPECRTEALTPLIDKEAASDG